MLVCKSQNGKRFDITGKGAAAIASQAGISESSAKAIMRGRAANNWGLVEMQRRRECMIIRYRLTPLGEKYRADAKAASYFLLGFCADWIEASDLSEKMLRAGFAEYHRKRVLQDVAGWVRKGYIEKDKRSGAIFGNL